MTLEDDHDFGMILSLRMHGLSGRFDVPERG